MEVEANRAEEAAETAVRRFYKAFERRDIQALRETVTANWQYLPDVPGNATGPDRMIPVFARLQDALPDMHITILDVLVGGSKVGVRAEVTGTQSGMVLGIPPSSKQLRFAIHSFHELRDGKIARTWHLEDWLSIFRQIGEIPRTLGVDDR